MKWWVVFAVFFIVMGVSSVAVADKASLIAEQEFALPDDGSTVSQLLIAGRYDSWVDGSLYSAMGYAPVGLTELLMYERQTLSANTTFALGLVHQVPFRRALCVRKDGVGRRTIGFESMSEGFPKGSRFLVTPLVISIGRR